MAPARAGTLSWQQRPPQRGLTGPRSRPTSLLASDNHVSRPPQKNPEPDIIATNEEAMSRNQPSQSLGANDPAWFKQTQERGLGSQAYRRNRDDTSDTASMTESMRLSGISRGNTTDPESRISPSPESVSSNSPPVGGSIPGMSTFGSNLASVSSGGTHSPFPFTSTLRFEPPSTDATSTSGEDIMSNGLSLAMSPSQGRISSERPSSPTKGLGGFVQSAMMKRSDSVNKRWSAQAPPGLSRGNSVASNTGGYGTTRYPKGAITPLSESRPSSVSCENSPSLSSRLLSSHSTMTVTQNQTQNDRPWTSDSASSDVSDAAPTERFATSAVPDSQSPPLTDKAMNPPASPSKRWSPSKASWLENAINKPESSKMKYPAPQQPAWMIDLHNAKQRRGSVDLSKESKFKEVSVGGLVRSPPLGAGYKPPTIGGLPGGFSAGLVTRSQANSLLDKKQRASSAERSEPDNTARPSSPTTAKSRDLSDVSNDIPEQAGPLHAMPKPLVASPRSERSSLRTSNPQSPSQTKPKPETLPKRDLRQSLKPRPDSGESKSQDEPEFKNVFGKLKRTQTQNYKAPDELKDNITRGKAGLNQTGGPKKAERRDEFKESIVQKKQAMIAPSASARITSAAAKNLDQSTPEAITKIRGPANTGRTVCNADAQGTTGEAQKLAPVAALQDLREKPKPVRPQSKFSPPSISQQDAGVKPRLEGNFASALAGVLQRGPLPMTEKPHVPQLLEALPQRTLPPSIDEAALTADGPQLTHVIKSRARGPKRRLPAANDRDGSSSTSASDTKPTLYNATSELHRSPRYQTTSSKSVGPLESRPLSNITQSNNNDNRKDSQPSSPRKPSTSIHQPPNKQSSPVLRKFSKEPPVNLSPAVDQKASRNTKEPNQPRPSPSNNVQRPQIQQQMPQAALAEQHRETESQLASSLVPLPTLAQLSGSRAPVKLPTRSDEHIARERAGLTPSDSLGLDLENAAIETQQSSGEALPPSVTPTFRSPPIPSKKSATITHRVASATLKVPPSATVQMNELSPSEPSKVAEILTGIFDSLSGLKQRITIDTQSVLNSRSSSDDSQKIKTLRKQISEITSNGKSVPVPAQQEHILFEDSLYLCTHVFGTAAGHRTTEVYLWCGDGVASSVVEDAQIFAKRTAKENNGKLFILKQGKEPTNFFQALGGIVIIRRGPRREEPSSATYMLCGRQHGGQVAFDEMEMSSTSLCKGFPYIIAGGSGKLYLWKGNGSGADELGCARLIGMDLNPTGDIEEIDDGMEPGPFWQCFPRGRENNTGPDARYWHLKPSCEKYTNRLYRIDVEPSRPKSSSGFMSWGRRGSAQPSDTNAMLAATIQEVAPFAQSDLVDNGVLVLDAFFGVFMYAIRSPHTTCPDTDILLASLPYAHSHRHLSTKSPIRPPFAPHCTSHKNTLSLPHRRKIDHSYLLRRWSCAPEVIWLGRKGSKFQRA